jgi:hypothetical protein
MTTNIITGYRSFGNSAIENESARVGGRTEACKTWSDAHGQDLLKTVTIAFPWSSRHTAARITGDCKQ